MTSNKPKIIAIVGATASGKTGVGYYLAHKFNGEIVSADSRQVYRGLDLGTGKEGVPSNLTRISKEDFVTNYAKTAGLPEGESDNLEVNFKNLDDEAKVEYLRSNLCMIEDVPQWMIDICEPEEQFSLFDYLELARLAIADILKRGKLPIIVGGTGLYVQGLAEGFVLTQISSLKSQNLGFSENGQSYTRERLDSFPVEKLQQILQEMNPEAYENLADPKNSRRLIRAIERTQEGLSMTKSKPDWDVLQIGLNLPKEELYRRIDSRVDDRFERGMLEEVQTLLDSGVSSEWLLNLGLEYRIITNFLLKNPPVFADEQYELRYRLMKDELKLRSHQYAKRQLTWLRRFPEINWILPDADIDCMAGNFLKKNAASY